MTAAIRNPLAHRYPHLTADYLAATPDRTVIAEHRIGQRTIERLRAELGIPSPGRRNPLRDVDLSRPTDDILRETGVTRSALWKLRRARGVAHPDAKGPRPPEPARRRKGRAVAKVATPHVPLAPSPPLPVAVAPPPVATVDPPPWDAPEEEVRAWSRAMRARGWSPKRVSIALGMP